MQTRRQDQKPFRLRRSGRLTDRERFPGRRGQWRNVGPFRLLTCLINTNNHLLRPLPVEIHRHRSNSAVSILQPRNHHRHVFDGACEGGWGRGSGVAGDGDRVSRGEFGKGLVYLVGAGR